MAHMLEIVNGQAKMAYVGETPWHSLGNSVEEQYQYDLDVFIQKSGLDTTNELVPLVLQDNIMQAVDKYAVRRKEDKKVLGVVGDRYTILQNRDAFQWFKPFLDTKEAALNTAGSLFEGSRVWILAKLNRDPMQILPNDVVEKYILLSHAHDGSLSVRVGFTPVRVLCANTMAMAHKDKVSKLLRVKHSKNVKSNLDNIRDTMNLINAEFEATAEQYRLLTKKDINQADLQKYVKKVFNLEDVKDEEISTRQKNIFGEIYNLLETGKGMDVPGVKTSWWGAYNAVSEYLSYNSGRNASNRMNSLWFGPNAEMNNHALEAALALAA